MDLNLNVAKRFTSFVTDWDYEQYLNIGGYGSGKSYATAQKIIIKLIQEKRKCLVIRKVYDTIRESTFALFLDILENMDFLSENNRKYVNNKDGKVIPNRSPLKLIFPNGSEIIFKGLDDEQKLKSVHGVSIVWIEEASEIELSAYLEILGRIREIRSTLHFILTCNPVGTESWIYRHFFRRLSDAGKEIVIQDEEELYNRRTLINTKINTKNGGVYYIHSVADDNPFIPSSYIARLDDIYNVDRPLWLVARWGRFGVTGIKVLPRFVIARNNKAFRKAVLDCPASMHFFGFDFGFEESFNALISCCVDDENKILYIYDEVYANHVTDDVFSERQDVRKVATRAANCDKHIKADCEEAKTIRYYQLRGFPIIKGKKFAGSRLQYTKKMQRFKKIVCSPACPNTIRELSTLTYKKDSRGNIIYDEFNIDPHTFSALWYGLDDYDIVDLKGQYNTRA